MNGTGDVHFDAQENKHGCGWMPYSTNKPSGFFPKKIKTRSGDALRPALKKSTKIY